MAQRVLSEVLDEYISLMRSQNLSPKTVDQHRGILRRFQRCVGDRRVGSVTVTHVEAFFYGRNGIGQHVMASTFNIQRGVIARFAAYLYRHRLTSFDWMLSVPRQTEQQTAKLRLSVAELQALPGLATTERDRAMVTMAVNCPARSGDLVRLRVGDVDLQRGEFALKVHKTKQAKMKPISLELDAGLRRWLQVYTEAVGPLDPLFYLFPSRGPRAPLWVDGRHVGHVEAVLRPERMMSHPEDVVQGVLRAAGYDTNGQGFHTIRRSVARAMFDHLCDQGHDYALQRVKEWLDHKVSSTTEGYIGVTTEQTVNDREIRGRSFLPAMGAGGGENVIPLRRRS